MSFALGEMNLNLLDLSSLKEGDHNILGLEEDEEDSSELQQDAADRQTDFETEKLQEQLFKAHLRGPVKKYTCHSCEPPDCTEGPPCINAIQVSEQLEFDNLCTNFIITNI